MSYLTATSLPDFNQATMSFWFRVPKDSLDRLKEKRTADLESYPVPRLSGLLPLMTFGKLFECKPVGYRADMATATYNVVYWTYQGRDFGDLGWVSSAPVAVAYSTGAHFFEQDTTVQVDPSYVGIRYDKNNDLFFLHINFQTGSTGNASGIFTGEKRFISDHNSGVVFGSDRPQNPMSAWDTQLRTCRTDSTAPGNPWMIHTTLEESSSLVLGGTGPDAFNAGSKSILVEPDTWHHVLLSFDLDHSTVAKGSLLEQNQGGCNPMPPASYVATGEVTDPCQLWLAFDDVNYTGEDLFAYYNEDTGSSVKLPDMGPNGFMSRYALSAYQSTSFNQSENVWDVAGCIRDRSRTGATQPTYTFDASKLPVGGFELGFPAAGNVMDGIYHVEMAEFQMWTGKTLDTANVLNRRAFIDFEKDENGNPIVAGGMKPVDPAKAEKLLGKKPELLLHTSKNWIAGKNTGSLKPDEKHFTPTGGIKQYKPDPSLTSSVGALNARL